MTKLLTNHYHTSIPKSLRAACFLSRSWRGAAPGLQMKIDVDTLVSSQERRALVVPRINRWSIAGPPLVVNRWPCSSLGLHRNSFVRASSPPGGGAKRAFQSRSWRGVVYLDLSLLLFNYYWLIIIVFLLLPLLISILLSLLISILLSLLR